MRKSTRNAGLALAALFLVLGPGLLALPAHADATTTTTTTTTGDLNASEEEAGGETFVFQAEVSRLLDIIINSLYSNKDIFLRELISNASDALDKIRLLSLTAPEALDGNKDLEVRISVDVEKGVLSIRDTGVGMTRDELVKNLGTIAKSGTSAFIDQVTKGASEGNSANSMNLIGQFGVGFYSAFLAADKVQVVSKSNDEAGQYVWESAADGNFAVYEDPSSADRPLGRGTQLNLFVKDEAKEYLDQKVLGDLVTQYSHFINYPIFLLETEKRDVQVEATEEDLVVEEEEEEEEDEEDDLAIDEDEEDEGEEDDEGPKMVTKTITEEVWRRKNDAKAIWLQNPSEMDESEYDAFFRTIAKGHFYQPEPEHFGKAHFKAEGDVEFRSILFIPKDKPTDMQQQHGADGLKSRIKLFVRRVFISDSFNDLIPSYLNFVIGVVDSDTLPLNVNRESLQHHASLKTIKKKLIRKTLDMMKKMADEEKSLVDEEDGEDGEDGAKAKAKGQYTAFWKVYGQFLKMGVIEDQPNRIRISKLIRFKTSSAPYNEDDDVFTDFESYVSRMKGTQKKLYYLIGSSLDELKASPFAERLISRGFEVIYLTEPLDEYLMQYLVEFNDRKFQNAAKEDLTLDDSEVEKKKQKQVRQALKPFTKWWKDLLPQADIDSVKVSNRLTTSPCVVVSSKYGYTANMEKIVKAQAMADKNAAKMYLGKKVLEVNPFHPMIKKLRLLFEAKDESEEAAAAANQGALLMYETSLLESGFEPEDPRAYAARVYEVLNDKLGVEAKAPVVDDFEYEKEEEKKDTEEEEVEMGGDDWEDDKEEL